MLSRPLLMSVWGGCEQSHLIVASLLVVSHVCVFLCCLQPRNPACDDTPTLSIAHLMHPRLASRVCAGAADDDQMRRDAMWQSKSTDARDLFLSAAAQHPQAALVKFFTKVHSAGTGAGTGTGMALGLLLLCLQACAFLTHIAQTDALNASTGPSLQVCVCVCPSCI